MGDLPPELQHPSFRRTDGAGGPNLRLLRLHPDLPANTVTAYIFNKFVHPEEHRYITPREAARLQGFGDRHVFEGPLTSTQHQVGNAVPPPLSCAVGKAIKPRIQDGDEDSLRVISLFSGAGGMDLGLAQSGFEIGVCAEIDPFCCETLRRNEPQWPVIERDLQQVSSEELMSAAGVGIGEAALVVGGTPCQPFSNAGRQKAVDDPRGTLFAEFVRIIKETKPRAFVLENVPNIVGVRSGKAFTSILSELESTGYTVTCKVLNAVDYGTPQLRRRIFFLGSREGLEYPFPEPTHGPEPVELRLFETDAKPQRLPYATAGPALQGLPPIIQP